MNEEPTVFVVDDDEAIRDSIGMLLDTVGIAHEAFASATDFLERFEDGLTGCLVLDIRMPTLSGLDLQERLIERGGSIPIIFITGHGDVPMAVEAMKRGAVDFIRKPFRDQELLNRVNEALDIDAVRRRQAANMNDARERFSKLTSREKEVFERVAQGQANKVIAIELGISERTVEIHRSQAMKKTNSRSLADLVRLKILLEQAVS